MNSELIASVVPDKFGIGMRIAVMQPYFFPYIGYFQLIRAVDKFVIFDDVNFINKGWINRNKILINSKANLFIIPLKKSSQNKLINEIKISDNSNWKSDFLKTIEVSYKKAPFFNDVYKMISEIVNAKEEMISKFIYNSLVEIKNYLDIETSFVESSSIYNNAHIKQQERIIDICKIENAEHYINPIGGKELYSEKKFKLEGIKLNFLTSNKIKYKQFNNNFIDSLSIIDVMMFNSKETIQEYLNEYKLI